MDRKHFLKLMALGGLLPVVVPGLNACKKYGPLDEYNGTVTIIGAGAAGLYAAWLLKQAGATVRILEATDRIGGRIRELTGFADFAIEVGAEEVHGHRSQWYDIVKDHNAEFIDDKDQTDLIYIDGATVDVETLADDPDYKKLMDLIDHIGDFEGADMSFEDYLSQQGLGARILPLANALLGNEYGTSNAHLGTLGVKTSENQWSAGPQNDLVKNKSFSSILNEAFASVIPDVQLNTHVFKIDYSGDEVICTDVMGQEHVSDKVIVTVSLGVLKNRLIDFVPDLSASKLDAINKLGFGPGMKIILKFGQQFWPDGTGSIYGSGLVPEFWVTSEGGRSAADHVLTAFVNGDNAVALSNMGTAAVATVCAQLDQMFGGTVASGSLIDSHIEDWTQNPYVLGTYSFPMVGSGNARELLAASVDGKLYFAGEATHTEGHNSTVHGAMETGYRAADEIVNS